MRPVMVLMAAHAGTALRLVRPTFWPARISAGRNVDRGREDGRLCSPGSCGVEVVQENGDLADQVHLDALSPLHVIMLSGSGYHFKCAGQS
jgi:hypothetical protein